MDKTYSPETWEQSCYQEWENHHYFEPQGEETTYCIMLPPPNVTGSLHMGHGFQHTLMDIVIRYHRMQGDKTLWQPGIDHAGISTQLVVEQQLAKKGIHRKDLSREAFLEQVWNWKKTYGNQIAGQMRRIGSSVDWNRSRFTMDKDFLTAVQKVFIQLYEEGLIYRGSRLVNWDPVLGTAISDLEVIAEEEEGVLCYIRYPLLDSNETVTVATTRPETLFGDVALAVNPEDTRYQHLIGKVAHLPLTNRTIPIIADSMVDPTFGTGCVKITPGHDFNDYEVAKRHQLPIITILTKQATLNNNVPVLYQNLDRFVAREKTISDLEKEGLLIKKETHRLNIPRGEKSQTIIEPLITEQWYVNIKPLAEPAMRAVQNGDIRFVPEKWSKTYFHWMENIEDWCISRQLWWGHRIPAWYDEQGQVYVGYSEKDIRFKHKLPTSLALRQDEDVLDTWFSSALWPFVTLGWPEKTSDLETFYPTDLLITGFDIIFFWVARMIMMGLKFTEKIPFKTVLITGLVRDSYGKKMSKSKGNVLDPIDIIDGIDKEALISKRTDALLLPSLQEKIKRTTEKEFPNGIPAYGTDALRFTFCALASNSRTLRFDLGRVAGYRNFCNKLWNAARFVLANLDEAQIDLGDGAFQYSAFDQWIISRLQQTIASAHLYFSNYRFDLLAQTLYDFTWHEYCNWYLEFTKPILIDNQVLAAMKRGARETLIQTLVEIIKLLHPIMPFITEAIWKKIARFTSQTAETIMLTTYPAPNQNRVNLLLEAEIDSLKTIIHAIRTMRSEMAISPAKWITVYLKTHSETVKEQIIQYKNTIIPLCKVFSIATITEIETIPISATAVVKDLEIYIPMADFIDKDLELKRLAKEITKLDKTITLCEAKLNDPYFNAHAPNFIIVKEQEKLIQAQLAKEKLMEHKTKVISF